MYDKKFKVICCGILMIGTIFTFTGCSDSAFNSSQLSESSQLSQLEESMVSSELTNTSSDSAANSDTVIENTEDAQKLAFGKILWDAYLYGILPDGKSLEQTNSRLGENSFAIFDVDNDGQDELLLYWTDASMVGTVGYIFGYRDHMVYNELSGYPSMRFYDNGIVHITKGLESTLISGRIMFIPMMQRKTVTVNLQKWTHGIKVLATQKMVYRFLITLT